MYSQYAEDEVVAAIFGDHVGRLLEIGAWDPKIFSNSRMFIEAGWEAVLVDFSPAPVRALAGEYGRCDRVKIVQAAIVPVNGGLRKFEITDDGLSSADEANIEKWRNSGGYFASVWVPTVPLSEFLKAFPGPYDFISVDAEGISVDLAIQLILSSEWPRVMCVEYDDRLVDLERVASAAGYKLREVNGTNVVMAR